MRNLTSLFISVFLASFFFVGQVGAQNVRGKVIDEEKITIPFATVQLLTPVDSLVIDGGITNDDGDFTLDAKGHSFPLLVVAKMLGYGSKSMLVDSRQEVTIVMSEEATVLGEAVITARKINHRMVPGGLSTSIGESPLAGLSDIYSVLRGIPLIEVNGSDIKVTGHGSPIIYINDRRMQDITQLEQIRPYLIDRIEVITSPDSKYSATVGAVIKIYTKREEGSGFSGSVSAYLGKQLESVPEYGGAAYLNYRTGAWDFSYNTSYYDTHRAHHNPYIINEARVGEDQWVSKDDGKFFFGGKTYTNVFGITYEDKVRSAGIRYSIVREAEFNESSTLSELVMNNEAPLLYTSQSRENTDWNYLHRPSIYYLRRFDHWKAQVDADFFANTNNMVQNIKERSEQDHSFNKDFVSKTGKTINSAGLRTEVIGDLDFGKLTFGGEYTWVQNKFTALNDKELELPDTYTQTRERMLALFAQFARPIGEWQLSAGLRMEYLDTQFVQNGKLVSEVSRRGTNLFPSLSFSGGLGKGWSAQLAVRSIINRPGYWQLQPSYRYINNRMYKSGNPHLRPLITYRVQGFVKKDWFLTMLSYDYNKDNIMDEYVTLMPDESSPTGYKPKTLLMSPINGNPYHCLRLTFNAAPSIGIWSPDLSVIFSQEFGFENWNFEHRTTISKPMVIINFLNTFSLPSDISLMISLNSTLFGQQKQMVVTKPDLYSFAEISKRWMNGQLTTSIRVSNLFNMIGTQVTTVSRYSNLQAAMYSPTSFRLNIIYRFNTAKSKYRGKGAINTVLDRMN